MRCVSAVVPTNPNDVIFLVDTFKHRIVKREGIWRLYCPERGPDDIIFCTADYPYITAVLDTPCPHHAVVGPRFGNHRNYWPTQPACSIPEERR